MNSEDIDIALAIKRIYDFNNLLDPLAFEQSRSAELRILDRCTGKTTFKVILAIAYAEQGKQVNYIINKRWFVSDIQRTLARYTNSARAIQNVHISAKNELAMARVLGRTFDIIIEDLYE